MNKAFGLLPPFLLLCFAAGQAQQDTVWVRRLSGTGNGDDEIRAIAADPAGNIYAVVLNKPRDSTSAIITAKYSPDGQLSWIRRFVGEGQVVPWALWRTSPAMSS